MPPTHCTTRKTARVRFVPRYGRAAFPGARQMNGQQNYTRWDSLLARHPAAGQPWMRPERGVYKLGPGFYKSGGGIFASSADETAG